MTEPVKASAARTIVVVGVAYAVIGIVVAMLDDSPSAEVVRMWRLFAWVASAAVGVAHIGVEHFRLRASPRALAAHAAAAVALGTFGLAVSANIHWIGAHTPGQRAPILALPIWPVVTAIPVFLLALLVAVVLARLAPVEPNARS